MIVFIIIIVLEAMNIKKVIQEKKLEDEKEALIQAAKEELKKNEDPK